MPEGNHIIDQSGDRKYFTIIPNILWVKDLTALERWLYATIKKVAGDDGECFMSTLTLAKEAGISTGSISKAKQTLQDKGLVRIVRRKRSAKGHAIDHITITDIWEENILHFLNRSGDERNRSGDERNRSGDETEEEPLKKNKEEEAAAAKKPTPKQAPKPPTSHPNQSHWTQEDHEAFNTILESWVSEFGKMTAREIEQMIGLWNEYTELEIHKYAWNEMVEAKEKRGVRPNLAYYQKCLATEARQNWVIAADNGGNNNGKV